VGGSGELASGAFSGGFAPLNDAGPDAPARAHRDALALPRPGISAALTGCCRMPGLADMPDEGSHLPAELRGVLLAHIDLVLRAAQSEPHRLIDWFPIKIVFQRDRYLLSRPKREGAAPAARSP
jgi:hypothetical protein